eukprot:CAMPEP_0171090014 /NCGR_PEP_ID=MMETSP0766_2-20121228/28282_1 /TAXON_ID=439317 /ORGANISM="Gambierdiscus australes, Strain CAWD 149" /LENGTH=60 /DNA_ID=CAMNT_0011547955 /DNA_START=178 /DNA_END=360 /DNA_ORIENTATION=-
MSCPMCEKHEESITSVSKSTGAARGMALKQNGIQTLNTVNTRTWNASTMRKVLLASMWSA